MLKRLAPLLLSLTLLVGCGTSSTAQSDPPSQLIAIQKGAQDAQESESQVPDEAPAKDDEPASVPAVAPVAASTNSPTQSGTLKVNFIDVGQADSILIQSGETAVLVDAGNNADGTLVVNYLKAQGVTKLAAAIATHPHEDHIGGMDDVLKSFQVDQFYMPNATSTTKTFEDMITAANASGAKKIQVKAGVALDVPGIAGTFLAPVNSGYADLNNYSAVLKITHGNTSFLLTGDAEDISENEMLRNGNLQSTLLKVGHHGSDSSTTAAFLKAVSPKFAVISVGKGNTYGHPTDAVLSRLSSAGVQVYRTDQSGTIIATSDGTTITMDKVASEVKANAPPANNTPASVPAITTPEPSPAPSPAPEPAPTPKPEPTPTPAESQAQHYVINTSSKKFHYPTCRSLPTKNRGDRDTTRDELINAGYSPCKICNP
ncbi:ComEC/Rec2 family competence protein [Desulfitobacterium chlororespirans]|uniref:Metal-dependent hydrolase, beta-lactamase superfamily II n=1 Tax=Desulfitobacterium chlororespirans DSM 11544 TaxID=1121395 RepID=A0A1M7UUI8_9FIRM|nr:ComEC/Rec2 family competence protein [Desulfitobacterium chlororespirans]SHN86587.1 Metal-dependent hydrolase, beta-lactamase superfamily II [Desulfitobacterium chlororespirans DSM 11544]